MILPYRRVLLMAACLFGAAQTSAEACRCREPATTKAAYSLAALVVEGEVIDLSPRPEIDGFLVRLKVTNAWKQDTPEQISFTTGSDCRFAVEHGKPYLLFFVKTPAGDLTTGRCMGNGPTAAKQKALAWLKKGARSGKVVVGP
jgi:hypothetical protein